MPLSVDDLLRKAQSHSRSGKIGEAEELYKQVLRKFPKNKRAILGYQKLKAGITHKDQLSSDPPHEQLQELGTLNNHGQFEEALSKIKSLVSVFPKSIALRHIQAASNTGLKKYDAAMESYKRLLKIKPDYFVAYFNMGNILRSKGELDTAIENYKKALSLKPDYAEAYTNMGIALHEQRKLEEAIEALNKGIAIKPEYAEAYYNKGNALKDQGKLEEAIEAFKKAIAIKPEYAEAYSNMGIILKEQGRLEEAVEAYSKALTLKPNYAEAYNNMGAALKEQGKLEEALEAYNEALAIKPDHAEAYNNMGNALQEQGKLEEALEAYNKALSLKPDYAEASDNMALALYSTGQFQKAASLFRKNSSSKSQTRLLKCLYELDNQSDFYQQLDYLINQGENNAVIGSYISRSKVRYGIDRENPFCNEPLKYASKIDLAQKCDFKDVFVEGAIKILSEGIVQSRKQTLLNKGSQTAGNVFDQMGPHTNKIQDIIRMEIEDYRLRFKESREGLITSWPAKYRLNGWIVKMKNGGAIKPHMHDEGWISGSVYINVPPKLKEDSGNLVVCLESETRKTDEGEYSKSIDVVTGSLCLFPSSLLHYTIPFNADEDRIVMAFDVVPE